MHQVQPWEWNDLFTNQSLISAPLKCSGKPCSLPFVEALLGQLPSIGQVFQLGERSGSSQGHFLGVWLNMGCRLSSPLLTQTPGSSHPLVGCRVFFRDQQESLGLGASLQRGKRRPGGCSPRPAPVPRQAEPWSLAPSHFPSCVLHQVLGCLLVAPATTSSCSLTVWLPWAWAAFLWTPGPTVERQGAQGLGAAPPRGFCSKAQILKHEGGTGA